MRPRLSDYPEYILSTTLLESARDFQCVFGQGGPVEIEIGCGKGTFLLAEAMARPLDNFVGVEWASKYYRYAVDRMGRWSASNVRILRADAAGFIRDLVPDTSISCFHVYFPDPWPKKRHHKRRFFSVENLHQMLRCLKPGGLIKTATDHAEYFEQIKRVLTDGQTGLEDIPFTPGLGARDGEVTGTNFERKYLAGGRAIYTLAVVKKAQRGVQPLRCKEMVAEEG